MPARALSSKPETGRNNMSDFLDKYTGRMSGVLRWEQLDKIWENLDTSDGWYLYEIGALVPEQFIEAVQLHEAIRNIDAFLHQQHDSNYCGVVYVDKLVSPTLLKIYHPRKMGASCGSSGSTVLPKWTLSRHPPVDLLDWAVKKDQKPSWWKHMLKVRSD